MLLFCKLKRKGTEEKNNEVNSGKLARRNNKVL